MNITPSTILGTVVASDYHNAAIFNKYHIDFCCNGQRSIAEACNNDEGTIEKIITELMETKATNKPSSSIDYQSWPADLLVDYIEKKHHRFVHAKIEEIQPYLRTICEVHGKNHPELKEIEAEFLAASEELILHMKKEEMIIFPYIKQMMDLPQNTTMQRPHFGTVKNPVQMMHHEHDVEGQRFRKISALSNNYTPPEDACATYIVTYALLKEFQEDLHLHIHLENNILFPAAIKMEAQLGNI